MAKGGIWGGWLALGWGLWFNFPVVLFSSRDNHLGKRWICVWVVLLLLAWGQELRARDDIWVWTSGRESQERPSFVTGARVETGALVDSIVIGLRGTELREGLAVSIIFQDAPRGFLRVFWGGRTNASMLSDNLLEGTTVLGRRTLVLDPDQLQHGGELVLQTTNGISSIRRMVIERVDRASVWLGEPESRLGLSLRPGVRESRVGLAGLPELLEGDRVQGEVVKAALTEGPVRVDRGLVLEMELTRVPDLAGLVFEVGGLPMDGAIRVWINDRYLGTASVATPDLSGPGVWLSADGAPILAGWREGGTPIPAGLLREGLNRVVLHPVAMNGSDREGMELMGEIYLRRVFVQTRKERAKDAVAEEALEGPPPPSYVELGSDEAFPIIP